MSVFVKINLKKNIDLRFGPGASSGNNSSPDSQDNAADSHNTISIEMKNMLLDGF